jgi:hypothetical protein
MDAGFQEVEEGACWWCCAPADSREHKLKRSDIVREYGDPPYTGQRTLTYFRSSPSGTTKHDFSGPKSPVVKFAPSLCAHCNGARSQPFDRAWDLLGAHLADEEDAILASQALDLEAVYGDGWDEAAMDLARYVAKHMVCRIVQELPPPARIDPALIAFLDGGAYPHWLSLDFCLDVGVRDMLRLTRSAPCPDRAAAEAGFLAMSSIFGVIHPETQQWSEPQGGLHYRWLAIYWKAGTPEPTASFKPGRAAIALRPCDGVFGTEGRQAFALALQQL